MIKVKFKATINHHNDNKGLGIVRATDKMKDFYELEDYIVALARMACFFAADSGMTTAEINTHLHDAAKALSTAAIKAS